MSLKHAWHPPWQVEAAKGALWDAFAEVAIYMEILHVQVGAARRGLFQGKHRLHAWCWRGLLLSAAALSLCPLGKKPAEQVHAAAISLQ